MHLKKEFKWKDLAFRIFKSLRNYPLFFISGFFLLAASVNTVSAETTTVQQQTIKISGVISDSSGENLVGASVLEKGTLNGTATNIDGAFTLDVAPNATIDVNYLGFLPFSFKVEAGKTVYNVRLKEDSRSLDEVVVVGYGVQKKKLVTGATVQVSGESLQRQNTTNPFTALQSMAPGVSIMQNSGQPGSGYIVNIRGIGTNGEARPLYVIDGVPAGRDALNDMSPADIESIDILKDAASAAVYGSRGANGVVLVTTKQGKVGKPKINYEGYWGQQYMAKKPDMLNAKEYIMVQNERRYNSGEPAYDWDKLLPYGMYDDIMNDKWKGSDWVDAFYNKGAVTQGHAFNLTGGGDFSKFSLGYSFTQQDGIFGEAVQSKYNRHTFRMNSDHVLLKTSDREVIKIGETLMFRYLTHGGIQQGDMYWNDMTDILRANPLMPIYNNDGTYYDQYSKDRDGWNFEGAFGNPIAHTATSSRGLNYYRDYGLRASAYLEIRPFKGLTFKSQYGYSMSASSGRTMQKVAYLSTNSNTTRETVNQDESLGYEWSLENMLTYNTLLGKHNITVQALQSVQKSGSGEYVSAGRNVSNYEGLGWDYAWIDNFIPTNFEDRWNGGGPWGEWAIASFMGRVQYNYNEKYMATVMVRADGTSTFAPGHRWGYFPSFSAGWIVSSEDFMDSLRGTLDFLKLTASWGQNGNSDGISGFQYITRYNFPRTALYYFGDDANKTQSTGAVPTRLKNPNITWETQQMLDLGLDSRWLNNRLGIAYNWFNRETKGWLLEAPIAAVWGINPPNINGGTMRNKGHELVLTWNDRVGGFNYGINLNGSYIQNDVTKIANTEGIIHGSSNVLAQGTGEFFRLQVGYPIGFFYGWKADGIFQNWNEVNNYTFSYIDKETGERVTQLIQPNARPGDVRFRDISGPDKKPDGIIDDNDRTMIGSGLPKYEAGFQFTASYKGFDLMVVAKGSFGFDIAKSYRSFADSETQNYTTQIFERWTGEGTSNKWPRLTNGNNLNYQRVSDIFLEKGDYVKIQNITLGYDLKTLFPKLPLSKARIFFAAQNLVTITGYSGSDPEIGYGGGRSYVRGIDIGYYPAAKSFMGGVGLTF